MQSRFLIAVVSALLFLTAPSLRATDVQWPTKLGSLTAEFGTIGTKNLVTTPSRSGIARLDQEAGFIGLSSQAYGSGIESCQMILYTYRDSSGAYQGYTSQRAQPTDDPIAGIALVKGNRVLWISGWAAISAQDRASIEHWLESISDGVASPPVATYLPEQGKEPFTERYALGPVAFGVGAKALGRDDAAALVEHVGFESGAEAMFAKYKSGKDAGTLLLIEYPTPQLAELHLRHLQRAILAAKSGASVERKGSLLSIVLAPTSQEYADKLRAAVNYETQVTWSEPSSTATDPPWSTVLGKIFIFTGIFMVVAVVMGVAFGGVRVITKRFFPGKVFDRPHQIEILQLGLSSKPIDPQDLY
jgi:hypothetical protein